MIGTKVRALADRGAHRDLIDVFAAYRGWNTTDLENSAAGTPAADSSGKRQVRGHSG